MKRKICNLKGLFQKKERKEKSIPVIFIYFCKSCLYIKLLKDFQKMIFMIITVNLQNVKWESFIRWTLNLLIGNKSLIKKDINFKKKNLYFCTCFMHDIVYTHVCFKSKLTANEMHAISLSCDTERMILLCFSFEIVWRAFADQSWLITQIKYLVIRQLFLSFFLAFCVLCGFVCRYIFVQFSRF